MAWNRNKKIDHRYDELWVKNIPKPYKNVGWGTKNKSLYNFIKDHYSIVQYDTCAYCRLPIRFGGYGEPIEHIVPRKLNSYWMYHPLNLCLSCFGCNTAKSDVNTLVNPINTYSKKYRDYPSNSSNYRILHPHFDTFSRFIKIDKALFCIPVTGRGRTKGAETIKLCNLNRMDCLYQRARLLGKKDADINKIALQVISSPYSRKEEIEAAQKIIDEFLKRALHLKRLRRGY